jgi:hypothetical protein
MPPHVVSLRRRPRSGVVDPLFGTKNVVSDTFQAWRLRGAGATRMTTMEAADMLSRMYDEHLTRGRAYEEQRTKMSQLILVAAALLVGFYGSSFASAQFRWAVAAFVSCLGVFGAVYSIKQHERSRFHLMTARQMRKEMEKLVDLPVTAIKSSTAAQVKREFPIARRWSLDRVWTWTHVAVAVFGLMLVWHD